VQLTQVIENHSILGSVSMRRGRTSRCLLGVRSHLIGRMLPVSSVKRSIAWTRKPMSGHNVIAVTVGFAPSAMGCLQRF